MQKRRHGDGNKAVAEAEQSPHFGGFGNAVVRIGNFRDKQRNGETDARRQSDKQQIRIGNLFVYPETEQADKLNHGENARRFADQQRDKNNQREDGYVGKNNAGIAEPEEKQTIVDNRFEIVFKFYECGVFVRMFCVNFMRHERNDKYQRQRSVHPGFVQAELRDLLGSDYESLQFVKHIRQQAPVQARLPYVLRLNL